MNQATGLRRALVHAARAAALLATGAIAASCGYDSVDATHYNQSCTRDDQCVAVLVGKLCDCACTYGAINVGDQAAEQALAASIHCDGSKVCGPCQSATAVCTAGTCTIK